MPAQNNMGLSSPPTAPSYQGNPNAFQGFNTSQLNRQGAQQIGANLGNEIAQARAQNASTGAGRSSVMNNDINTLTGQAGQTLGNLINQNQLTSYEQQLQQQQMANQYNEGIYGSQAGMYGAQVGAQSKQTQNYLGTLIDLLPYLLPAK